jgi:hypothetical protein
LAPPLLSQKPWGLTILRLIFDVSLLGKFKEFGKFKELLDSSIHECNPGTQLVFALWI